MDNKTIQEKRMKGYFIQAAKEILKGEGLKNISVRNIADQAGYSYATMYNYFKDLKDLFFECIKDFQEECELYVAKDTEKTPRGVEKIKAISRAYVNYFIQYPNVFELLYLEKISDLDSKQPTLDLICNFLDKLCAEEWDYCIREEMVSIWQVNSMRNIIKYQLPGLLLFYLNRQNPKEYKEFMALVDKQLDKIVKVENAVKKGKMFEPEALDFIFENDKKLICFMHYTKAEKTAKQIINEGFIYVESFYTTAEQVVDDKLDLMYKHNMYKNYGNFIILICIARDIYNYYSNELKNNSKIGFHVENVLTEQQPKMNDNDDMVYILPPQFIKGYFNHETGEVILNPVFNPNYNPPIFTENLIKNKS